MLTLLEPFDESSLSRSLVKVYPFIISQASPAIKNFLKSTTYRPPLMKNTFEIYWPEEAEGT
jgi:hypothetical protein